jgi:hypothetical protein
MTPLDPMSEVVVESGAESGLDPQVGRLLKWAALRRDMGIGVSLTVLVGGFQVGGVLATPEQFADYVDRSVGEAIDAATERGDESAAALRPALVDDYGARTTLAQARDVQEEIDRELEPYRSGQLERDAMPIGLQAREIVRQATPPNFALLDAVVTTPSGDVQTLPFIRVHTAAVVAWWVGSTAPDPA